MQEKTTNKGLPLSYLNCQTIRLKAWFLLGKTHTMFGADWEYLGTNT